MDLRIGTHKQLLSTIKIRKLSKKSWKKYSWQVKVFLVEKHPQIDLNFGEVIRIFCYEDHQQSLKEKAQEEEEETIHISLKDNPKLVPSSVFINNYVDLYVFNLPQEQRHH